MYRELLEQFNELKKCASPEYVEHISLAILNEIEKNAGLGKLFKNNLKMNLGNPLGLAIAGSALASGASAKSVAADTLVPGLSTAKSIKNEALSENTTNRLSTDIFKPKTMMWKENL